MARQEGQCLHCCTCGVTVVPRALEHDQPVDYGATLPENATASESVYEPREMGPLRFGGAALAAPAVAVRCLPPVPIVFLALKASTRRFFFFSRARARLSQWVAPCCVALGGRC